MPLPCANVVPVCIAGFAGAALGVCDVLGMIARGSITDPVPETQEQWSTAVAAAAAALRTAYEREGFVFVQLQPQRPAGL